MGYDGDGPDVKASLHDANYTCQFLVESFGRLTEWGDQAWLPRCRHSKRSSTRQSRSSLAFPRESPANPGQG